ncbi:MAG: bifunctional 4-hydroxy-2-oxoglutarate aldolase/2-dehydro-3-deoxy-phosphogluconate aldolase [Alkalinema sp. RU_4_3]|nr:bifunctional 4-hydroxy-2-oxoglutarate aldolase/2-dehydro-3-deoxy-phosphogluconate aldolase [Alkalinema sp. RU_4_3]
MGKSLTPSDWIDLLKIHRAIAVIRSDEVALGLKMAQVVAAGGLRLIEVTWNSSNPAQLVTQLREQLPNCRIGVGTILAPDELREAIAAGAEYAFMPYCDRAVMDYALHREIPIIPGALTPTEIMNAWQMGATCIKVFPVQSLGGPTYIKSLRDPLGDLPLIPTGGVTVENARSLVDAGAIAVGLAGNLFPKEAIRDGDWGLVQVQAEKLVRSFG